MNEESNAPIVEGSEKPERRIEVCDLPISELYNRPRWQVGHKKIAVQS